MLSHDSASSSVAEGGAAFIYLVGKNKYRYLSLLYTQLKHIHKISFSFTFHFGVLVIEIYFPIYKTVEVAVFCQCFFRGRFKVSILEAALWLIPARFKTYIRSKLVFLKKHLLKNFAPKMSEDIICTI
jgi:hypothetical protein